MRRVFFASLVGLLAIVGLPLQTASAAPGDLLGTVTLPGNGGCNVTLTFTGTHALTVQGDGCASSTLGVYTPPAGGNGAATLVATKNVVDGGGNPVTISGLAWDPSRNMVWAAHNGSDSVYLIDIGDPSVSGNATATFQFNPGMAGANLTDGLEWDPEEDTLWYSSDVSCDILEFGLGTTHPLGAVVSTVTPKNAAGNADCGISGVEVGTENSLYVGRNGFAQIRRVDKTTGAFISQFATTSGRVEDLTCDPVTYAPNEAILAKDAFNGLYEAFEVDPGTCPLDEPPTTVEIDIKPGSFPNSINLNRNGVIPVAILTTESFNAVTVDASTVCFGDAEDPGQRDCTEAHGMGHLEDVDLDGDFDMVLHFETQETGIDAGDTEACLTGATLDGSAIEGCDSVRTL